MRAVHSCMRLTSLMLQLFRFLLTNWFILPVTLNRPKALNALCTPLFKELNDALQKYDDDKDIGAIIITGSEKAFAGTCIRRYPFSLALCKLGNRSDFPSRCRHQGNGAPDFLLRLLFEFHSPLVAPPQQYPHSCHRCRLWLRSG